MYCIQGANRAGGRTPRTPRSGEAHACSGASCCVGEPFWAHQNAKNLLVAGAAPRTPLGSLQRSPRPASWWGGLRGGFAAPSPRTPLTILSLCSSCVYVHTCMKMHCYFLLNVKHGASQLYWGEGGSNYLAPALGAK